MCGVGVDVGVGPGWCLGLVVGLGGFEFWALTLYFGVLVFGIMFVVIDFDRFRSMLIDFDRLRSVSMDFD